MKELVFATLMCVSAMSAKAQVITSETVNNAYVEVSNQTDGNFAYNVERTGDDITTMYVYEKSSSPKGMMSLKPHLKYAYSYTADGMLTSRVAYRWSNSLGDWVCAARYDFTLADGNYRAEYSRYNHEADCFDQPVERMDYSLMPDDSIDHVTSYYRDRQSPFYQLVSDTTVTLLMASSH